MIAFALGADLAAAIPLVDTHEVTTNPATAAAAVKAGETVVAVGGPAIQALGWHVWAKPGAVTTSGKWTAVNGSDRFHTRRLAVGLLP